MKYAVIVILLYLAVGTPCRFYDAAGFSVPAYPQYRATDNAGFKPTAILSVPRSAETLLCQGYEPVNLRKAHSPILMRYVGPMAFWFDE
jgi:hypothetical protein